MVPKHAVDRAALCAHRHPRAACIIILSDSISCPFQVISNVSRRRSTCDLSFYPISITSVGKFCLCHPVLFHFHKTVLTIIRQGVRVTSNHPLYLDSINIVTISLSARHLCKRLVILGDVAVLSYNYRTSQLTLEGERQVLGVSVSQRA